jgi:hypothetical protein
MQFKVWLNEMDNETIYNIMINLSHDIEDTTTWSILHDAVEEAGYPTNINQLHKEIVDVFTIPANPRTLHQRQQNIINLAQRIESAEPAFLDGLFRLFCIRRLHRFLFQTTLFEQLEELEESNEVPVRQNAAAVYGTLENNFATSFSRRGNLTGFIATGQLDFAQHAALRLVNRYIEILANLIDKPLLVFNLYGMNRIMDT